MKDEFGKADKSSADRGENYFEKRNYKNEVTRFRKQKMLGVLKTAKRFQSQGISLVQKRKRKLQVHPYSF